MQSIATTLRSLIGKEISIIDKNLEVRKVFVMSETIAKMQEFKYKPNHAGCYLCQHLFKKELLDIDLTSIIRVFDNENKMVFCKQEFSNKIRNEKNKLRRIEYTVL